MFLIKCTFRGYSEMNKLYRECEQRTARLSKNIMADFLNLHYKKHWVKNQMWVIFNPRAG